ncbi:MAG: T9SS type A sorting domain-containing protein, partial [Flavobacteriaceae bacterium]|nr:T9SS type A sorting domain-containing protein [Flavobacteriaceae bacterium]
VMMYDVNGRMVHTQEFSPAQEIQLTIGDISNGTYFLKVTSQDKRFNAKLIKI